jgi:very-short-patch-repair endonuclease
MKRLNIGKSRMFRKNQTDAERKLWSLLRNRQLNGVKFRRQVGIGKYIMDFYAPAYKLCIEADGGQHYKEEDQQKDYLRSVELLQQGITVIRFNNIDILTNPHGVTWKIIETIGEIEKVNHQIPSPLSSP